MRRLSLLCPAVCAAIALAAMPQAAVAGQTVYVSDPGSNQVALFDTDSGGRLLPKTPSSINVGNGPVGVAITPNGRWGYIPSINDATVYQFGVGGDGLLSPLTPPGASAGVAPGVAATTPDGNSLYSVNQGGGDISQYSVGADGLLTPKSPPSVATNGGSVASLGQSGRTQRLRSGSNRQRGSPVRHRRGRCAQPEVDARASPRGPRLWGPASVPTARVSMSPTS